MKLFPATPVRWLFGESTFRQNIARIAGGTALSQIVALATMPVLARLYMPDDFGALAVFVAIHTIVAAVSTLKFELSIILPASEDKAVQLSQLAMLSSGVFSIILALVLIGAVLGSSWRIPSYFLLLPISALLSAAYTCGQQWSARARDYRRFARAQWINALVNAGSATVVAFCFGHAPGMLVFSYVLGLAVAVVYLHRGVRIPGLVRPVSSRSIGGLLETAREYRRFPLMVLPSSSIATFGQTGQPFILQLILPLRDVGIFAVASRVLAAPVGLIGGAVGEAFRAEFVSRVRDGRPISEFFGRTLRAMLAVGVFLFAVVATLAPAAFELAFGRPYHEAGVIAQMLCGAALAQFLVQPFAYVFVATDHVRTGLKLQAMWTIVPLVGLAITAYTSGLSTAVLVFSFLNVVTGAILVGVAFGCCRQFDRQSAGRANA